jgi:DNA adenine methylase
MKYMGSKNRIAKDLLPIILKDRKPDQWYVEPFVGGANMIDKVEGKRIGSDSNPFVIEALKLIRDSPESLPDHVTEEYYQELKDLRELNGVTGFVGFTRSFKAKWFGGYASDKRLEARGQNSSEVISRQAKNNALNQSPKLKEVRLVNESYLNLEIPKNSIIYCDPPYEGTTKYKDGLNHAEFWQWVREKSLEGHSVFVSEYNAPEDFICVWEKALSNNLREDKAKATEKLFIFNDLY